VQHVAADVVFHGRADVVVTHQQLQHVRHDLTRPADAKRPPQIVRGCVLAAAGVDEHARRFADLCDRFAHEVEQLPLATMRSLLAFRELQHAP
jgi:hypothetical protein